MFGDIDYKAMRRSAVRKRIVDSREKRTGRPRRSALRKSARPMGFEEDEKIPAASLADTDANRDSNIDTGQLLTNKKNKKKKSGGFQSMGLNYSVLKGVLQKGYRVPTPIQRKSIPIILDGRDVVGMARTGSGKTAAFLLPMFERLKAHSPGTGARALILSPTRELALQTLKFTRELGKFTHLKTVIILGGDKIEDQFEAIHGHPDIIIATPGRFLHVVMEMDMKLTAVEYVVFDEADRLFEMGFWEQLQEIVNRLPEHRQTLLFSATLPKLLADFVKAGLRDPVLIRLDIESKLSELLQTNFISCRADDKPAVLLHMLKFLIKPEEMTVVFVATRHHVEYLKEILSRAEVPCTYVYSALDQSARKINVGKFQNRVVKVMLVTDIAARGIDIPLLDNVINYNFPAKPKLFVHRVGRVARAGRSGTAFSLVSPDEAPYVLDLFLFLGRPLKLSSPNMKDTDGVYGGIPQALIDEEADMVQRWYDNSVDLRNLAKVCNNAYQQYVRSRPMPSAESVKRMKEFTASSVGNHPLFCETSNTIDINILTRMQNYRPSSTIFEIGATAKSEASRIMRAKRQCHTKVIDKFHHLTPDTCVTGYAERESPSKILDQSPADLEEVFPTVIGSRKRKRKNSGMSAMPAKKQKAGQHSYKDEAFYIPYKPLDHHQEKGLKLEGNFGRQVSGFEMDIEGDDTENIKQQKKALKWDRKKKKFINEAGSDPKKKKIQTESGAWIPASYKSDVYKRWKENSKIDQQTVGSSDEEHDRGPKERQCFKKGMKRAKWGQPQKSSKNWPHKWGTRDKKGKIHNYKRELKTKEEIFKSRQRQARLHYHQIKKSAGRGRKGGRRR